MELPLLEGIFFHLRVHHPYKALEGFMLRLRVGFIPCVYANYGTGHTLMHENTYKLPHSITRNHTKNTRTHTHQSLHPSTGTKKRRLIKKKKTKATAKQPKITLTKEFFKTLHSKALKLLQKSLLTDLNLLYTPSQIALAALYDASLEFKTEVVKELSSWDVFLFVCMSVCGNSIRCCVLIVMELVGIEFVLLFV